MRKFFSSYLHPVISGYKSGVMRGNTHKKSLSAMKIGQFGNSWLHKFMQLAISMNCIENTATYCRISLQMCMWGKTWTLPCGYLNLGSTAGFRNQMVILCLEVRLRWIVTCLHFIHRRTELPWEFLRTAPLFPLWLILGISEVFLNISVTSFFFISSISQWAVKKERWNLSKKG